MLSLGLKGAGEPESWYTEFQYSRDVGKIMFRVSNQLDLI